MTRGRLLLAGPIIAVYLGSIVLANYLTTHYGFIDIGFGKTATAGTFAAGGALVVRDFLQDAIGRVGVAVLIIVGAGISFIVASSAIATASGVAFLASEAFDMALYTPLRRRGRFGGPWWSRAVLLGAAIGAVADTIIFLWIAFGWASVAPALAGQLLAKGEVVLVLLAFGQVVTREVFREPIYGTGA